jgi:hypothetical protein
MGMQLLVIGDDELPSEHRWAILRSRDSEPILAVKQEWSRDIRTLTEALACLPALTENIEGAQRLSVNVKRSGRNYLTYRRG